MTVEFCDLEDEHSAYNGMQFTCAEPLIALLREFSLSRPPFMCDIVGENEFKLTVGIGSNWCCVQHSPVDGDLPYVMALSLNPPELRNDLEFLVGGTATPIDVRYAISFGELAQIVTDFIERGARSSLVRWESF